jgi:hypothetical protein
MQQTLDWKRVRGALFREAQTIDGALERLDRVQTLLPKLIALCGTYSQSRKIALKVGRIMLGAAPQIIVPTCPAYPSREGKFRKVTTLGCGVSLVTRRHRPFLKRLVELVPEARITILVADHEARDPALQKATRLSQEEFSRRMAETVRATRRSVAPLGWEVLPFSEFFPSFLQCRAANIRWIGANPEFEAHIAADTLARERFYRLFCAAETPKAKRDRTVKTAAEYVCLGRFAAERGLLIVNHTTTNLAWYLKTEVGVLHHDVRVY